MKILRKLHGYIQPHIVTVFSVLLFASFALVGLAFNFAMNLYISQGAVDAIRVARASRAVDAVDIPLEIPYEINVVMRTLRGAHRLENVYFFPVYRNFELRDPENATPTEILLSEYFANTRTPPAFFETRRIREDGRTFFVAVENVPLLLAQEPGRAYIFYLEVTDTVSFIAVVNRLLIISVVVIWLVAMLVGGVLADSMMKPLRDLRDFVKQIGRGDFTPNSQTFANEEFQELNNSLNNAVRQLAAYDNEQKTFFQNVSHELRTPLMAIKSYAEGIKLGIMDAESASETILEATDRLTGLVEKILYVSRIDNVAPPAMETMNLCHIVEEQIRRQTPFAQSKNISLKYASDGEPIYIKCAVDYIDRAMENLISNAMRYAKAEILVECYAIGSSATIRVIDDGPGFDDKDLERAFERFYRGKSGLTGIGLATVKSIVDQHNGFATAENGAEKGAILSISLPRKK